jgi:hypothetical protein
MSILAVDGPGYDQFHFVGHIDIVPEFRKDKKDDEYVLHTINEECGDSYLDIRTGTTLVHREKSDQEGESEQSNED